MRKIQLLGVALLALLAFGALTAISASAAFLLAEWLVGGAAVATELLVELSGEVLLEGGKVLGSSTVVLCSWNFAGWVGPNSLGFMSEILNLEGVAISNTPLSGESLSCTSQSLCESNTTVLVWPVGLPTETEVELLEQTGGPFFIVLFLKEFGWEITDCLVLGIDEEDTCTTPEVAVELTLEGTALLGAFSVSSLELTGGKPVKCTEGGSESGLYEAVGTFTLGGGGELTASSESSIS